MPAPPGRRGRPRAGSGRAPLRRDGAGRAMAGLSCSGTCTAVTSSTVNGVRARSAGLGFGVTGSWLGGVIALEDLGGGDDVGSRAAGARRRVRARRRPARPARVTGRLRRCRAVAVCARSSSMAWAMLAFCLIRSTCSGICSCAACMVSPSARSASASRCAAGLACPAGSGLASERSQASGRIQQGWRCRRLRRGGDAAGGSAGRGGGGVVRGRRRWRSGGWVR